MLLISRIGARHIRKKPLHVENHYRSFTKFDSFGNSPIPASKQRFVPTSGTYPKGFLVGSTNVGIKPDGLSQPDLILVASEKKWETCGAAVLTKNEFPAASVVVTRDLLKKSKGRGLRGVVANSWCANLLTGEKGLEDSRNMSREAGRIVSGEGTGQGEESVMVMHTGMGGQRLRIDNIIQGFPNLQQEMGTTHDHWIEAARGICTTDTFPKLASRTFTLPSSPETTFSIAGITKGAGMIHPNMATTLGIICTDAPITPPALQQLLSTAADKSYNCISIEGDTSTNDMVAMLANGAAAPNNAHFPVDFDSSAESQSEDFIAFQRMLIEFMADLAKLVVRDGEGATKFITIRVRGAPTYPAGKHIASVIARSVLFKTGVYGKDPNPIGVLAALGYSLMGTEFAGKGIINPESTSVSFMPVDGTDELNFVKKGRLVKVDEVRAKKLMEEEDVEVIVDLRDDGRKWREDDEEAVYWTCDITHEFVTINGDFGN
ncbi:arginine biosynthesis bifunctional protein [Sclerotinia sclerotiorum 1980 UF-70]|uniref:Arginine biosynthesis bifunctional protein ArgJ 2, mitochondrial n=2 Tax=Sclerotinia sclerotiorum (strain ATCC 18683 / 1980 / Ss-1) TaxID=665079 RepID=ARGJ2_SCLS1|nr:arginine biosynthesis bifunctional protein [Sclerotinia sclerotiorum 1980 UF-70]A7EDG9.1 RecName: Full=Arginine biosynthesis bifunctional protein ArgJ 2, mitochondrial; Includes: RecName: Full=Glutamate N-acetyltransferase; Short=GAT; AltName: Full=Ornithine acetyltransferase; Short=OATase; AltName: Full=Ornithine transacetylase; Includes: RecName: Full=Amino-acid acetyltransferase; AltName: Full=N-acetylglutamate synthase; Short=AGS; Contains: RecName: Full=Arginine biosynthesis bifunctional p